jgi:hypothetical protein
MAVWLPPDLQRVWAWAITDERLGNLSFGALATETGRGLGPLNRLVR